MPPEGAGASAAPKLPGGQELWVCVSKLLYGDDVRLHFRSASQYPSASSWGHTMTHAIPLLWASSIIRYASSSTRLGMVLSSTFTT